MTITENLFLILLIHTVLKLILTQMKKVAFSWCSWTWETNYKFIDFSWCNCSNYSAEQNLIITIFYFVSMAGRQILEVSFGDYLDNRYMLLLA